MRQNAGPILALAEFKRLISVIKYQELMPTPLTLTCIPFLNFSGAAMVGFEVADDGFSTCQTDATSPTRLFLDDNLRCDPLLEQADMGNDADCFLVLTKTLQSIDRHFECVGI